MVPLLFIHIPKTAGTSIRKTLAEVGVADHPPTEVQFSKHTAAEAYRRHYGDQYDKAHTFAVVRNPLEWLWSFYRFVKWTDTHIDTGKPWRYPIYEQVAPLDFPGFVDFVCVDDGFNRLFCAKKLREVGIKPFCQAAYVKSPEGKIIVNSIFRFERLRDGLPRWLSSLGIPVQSLKRLNVSRQLKASTDDVYTDRMRSLVESRFAADFNLWESVL